MNDLTSTSTTAKFALGTSRAVNGNSYVYVQLSANAANAAVDGTVLYMSQDGIHVVTDDVSATHVNNVRGVAIGAIAKGSYGWIQTWGNHAAVKTDGGDDITFGDALIGDTTVDGVCDSVAAGTAPTNKVIGWAYLPDDDTANTVAAYLTLERGA